MKFFIDTANTDAIREFSKTSLIDGVTTNPTLIKQSGKKHEPVIKEICDIMGTMPVSAEVIATEANNMVLEGEHLAKIADNVVVKVPLTWDGLLACERLRNKGIKVNVTLCFNLNQAIMAAKAGASYISPFIGRLDDIGLNGLDLIKDIRLAYNLHKFDTEILGASIRSPHHVTQCALLGANVVTVPPGVLQKITLHPLTDKGLESFLADAAKT